MRDYLLAIVQGIVEGLTEFLPVSSTGHLILSGYLLDFTEEAAKSFEIFIQLGAILAVAVLYRQRFRRMLEHLAGRSTAGGPVLTISHMLAAMGPAVVLGLAAHGFIKEKLFTPWTVIIGLVAGGIFMLVAERFQPRVRAPEVERLTIRQTFGIGLFQCLSLWPGFSRSGATIAGGLLLGANHKASADFSFMLAVPMMAAATGLDLVKSLDVLGKENIGPFAVGFVVSFVVAWIAVVWFLRLLNRVRLAPFAWYRFAVAIAFAAYLLATGR